jgi:RNA polymerase sigma factor (sigma-70 family)
LEASALHAPALGRLSLSPPLLRLRSDEQLVALFRAGNDDAFASIVERYRQRLFAYVRQMLSAGSRQDAEDVLQDVFVRAYGALRADSRDVNLRAWLYRVAHNRCIDQLRRPVPAASEVFEMSRTPLLDPIEEAQRREDLRRLVADVGRLPEQQRSALLMREIDGMAYADIAAALDVTVPAVKSLLVRARVGLAEAVEARHTDCTVIRVDLTEAYDRGVKASGRARRHMRECTGCREYRTALRGVRRSFAALSPVAAAGPLAVAAKLLGLGSAGGGAAAGGTAAVGGGAAVGTTAATATACKVAAVVCATAITAGGAVEVKNAVVDHDRPAKRSAPAAAVAPRAPAPVVHRAVATAPATEAKLPGAGDSAAAKDADKPAAADDKPAVGDAGEAVPGAAAPTIPASGTSPDDPGPGGAAAPAEDTATGSPTLPATDKPATDAPVAPGAEAPGAGQSDADDAQNPAATDPATSGGTTTDPNRPPAEH